jgi:hypothetical protein
LKDTSRLRRAGRNRPQGSNSSAEGQWQLPIDNWPPEGRTLGAIFKQFTSQDEWSELTNHTGELLPPHLNTSGMWAIIPANPPDDQTTIHPFLKIWNTGRLIAKGRRGDLLAAPEQIPPPSVGYDIWVADFTRSIIRDPTFPDKRIYDLRFFPPNAKTKSVNDAKNSTAKWVAGEAKRMKALGEIGESTHITELAKMLASRMEQEKSVKAVGWRYIKNQLREWGLWPIASIE